MSQEEIASLRTQLQVEENWRKELQSLTIDQQIEINRLRAALKECVRLFQELLDNDEKARRS